LDDSLVNEAISYFQTASYLFGHDLYKKDDYPAGTVIGKK
jgi:hypothetical protein